MKKLDVGMRASISATEYLYRMADRGYIDPPSGRKYLSPDRIEELRLFADERKKEIMAQLRQMQATEKPEERSTASPHPAG